MIQIELPLLELNKCCKNIAMEILNHAIDDVTKPNTPKHMRASSVAFLGSQEDARSRRLWLDVAEVNEEQFEEAVTFLLRKE